MNKLEELVKKHRALLEYNPVLPKEVVDVLVDHMKEACIQYAKSIVPTDEEIIQEYSQGKRTLQKLYLDKISSDEKDLLNNT